MFESKVESKFESKTLVSVPKANRPAMTPLSAKKPTEGRQRRVMLGALTLLLIALGGLLYKDRDFWFPDDSQVADELTQPAAAQQSAAPTPKTVVVATALPNADKKQPATKPAVNEPATAAPAAPTDAGTGPVATVTHRTVLPPLEVEVVAGDTHRTLHPGTNSVRVDMQPGAPTQPAVEAATSEKSNSAAKMTSNAAERVQMSADTTDAVSRPVKPGYPLLARQMKVQGSVILRALISKDGMIQNLRVLSGPPILASAAEEAVRQWHFKPHFEGSESVETQATITVNFTISTN
jgi:TonB family protein